MGQNPETKLQNDIRLALSKTCIIFRANVGGFYTKYGGYISTGLPEGFPDLFGFRKRDGKMVFIEVKMPKGVVQDNQKHFMKVMDSYDVLHGVARSVEDAERIVEGER